MILLKKAIRSMLRHKKAYLSCIALMALGVWTFTTMNTALMELDVGKEGYYEDKRLADAFATVSQIPVSALTKLEEIEGIEGVEGRLIKTARVLVAEDNENVYRLKLISTQIGMNDERLNAYYYEGKDLEALDHILVGLDFYNARGYADNPDVQILLNQRLYDFEATGSVLSPEYVYIVEKETELFSDKTKFNFAYVDENIMMHMMGMEGAYNDLAFKFEDGVVYEDVKNQLEYELKNYGLIKLHEQKDLFSYVMTNEEIEGGKSMSTSMPMAFVGMAAVVLYLMLKRIIEQDRTQIGILKSFGYSNGTILRHYLFFGLVTGALGAISGIAISYATIGPYIDFYLSYYQMPIEATVTNHVYYIIGGIMSVGGGLAGAYFGAKSIIKIKPAEAMRPVAPKPIKNDIVDFVPVLKHLLTSRGFMAARNIIRNKVRSTFVVVGIMFSFSMMAIIGMTTGMMDSMFFNQFNHVLKYDAEVALAVDVPYEEGVQAISAIDGVTYAEGVLKTPVLLHKGHKQFGTTLVGIRDGNYLYKAYDDALSVNIPIKDDGMILASMVADKLGVGTGDYVFIQSPYLNSEQKVYITDVVEQGVGFSGFMDLGILNQMFGQDQRINSLIIEAEDIGHVREVLVNSEQVDKVEDKAKTLELYESLLGSYAFIIWMIQGVAITIGFTIIYNTAAISMSERSREYATLRVLGMDIKEVKEIMGFEYWILWFVGIAVGVPFTLLLNYGLQNMVDVDAFSWPSTVPFDAYIVATIGCALAVILSNRSTVKAIRKLNMVEVLKERE